MPVRTSTAKGLPWFLSNGPDRKRKGRVVEDVEQ